MQMCGNMCAFDHTYAQDHRCNAPHPPGLLLGHCLPASPLLKAWATLHIPKFLRPSQVPLCDPQALIIQTPMLGWDGTVHERMPQDFSDHSGTATIPWLAMGAASSDLHGPPPQA